MSKLRGFAGPLLALAFGVAAAIALIIVIAVGKFNGRNLLATVANSCPDDFPVGVFVPVLILVLVLPCVLACLHKGRGSEPSQLPKSLPVPDAQVFEGESRPYRNTRVESLKRTTRGERTLSEMFARTAASYGSKACLQWREVKREFTEDSTFVDPTTSKSMSFDPYAALTHGFLSRRTEDPQSEAR